MLLSLGAFVYFALEHKTVLEQLARTRWTTVAVLWALYALVLACLVLVSEAMLQMCDKAIGRGENTQLTAYSSVVNFFGPLQSGPGFRAVYLKRRHGVSLARYALASLVYYGLFAFYSGLFLLYGVIGVWGVAAVAAIGLLAWVLGIRLSRRPGSRLGRFNRPGLHKLALATLLQLSLVAVIYYIELRSISPGVGAGQALVYTGAANFAMFVSLTPGAIGFREAFLLFSQQLHHISTVTVLSASLLDRGVYVSFLLIVFGVTLVTHARSRLIRTAGGEQPHP